MLSEKILLLKQHLIECASLTENMIAKSIKGLIKREREYLVEVIEVDEPRVNTFEIEIDEMCTGLIAQYQPTAKDLRTILMVLKINNDLERVGDDSVNISQSALFIIERPQIKPFVRIPKMAEETIKMLNDSIDSFINEAPSLAKSVCERDNIVDNHRNEIFKDLISSMTSDPQTIERAIHVMRIATNLERIADLSTNICEDIVYMVEGKVIKHHKGDMEY
ncbi:phosphate signaling complex protein PhoU [bacterium]|nr:phosphate signaling complex protein PhoU [bacterium]